MITPTRMERDFLSSRISLSVLPLSKDGHSFLVITQESKEVHLVFASCMAIFPTSSLSAQGGMFTSGSACLEMAAEPSLANSSAFSLPGIPSCPGTSRAIPCAVFQEP